MNKIKEHWEFLAAAAGLTTAWTVQDYSHLGEFFIVLITILIVSFKAFIFAIKAWVTWRNRNNTQFFLNEKDDE